MKKQSPASSEANVWDDAPQAPTPTVEKTVAAPKAPQSTSNAEYDLEGLMTDFPTAKELERFVFDETGIVLNLKGRANKLKYQVAMDALNGVDIDPKFVGESNPYIEKAEMVPIEPLKAVPDRDPTLPDRDQVQNVFLTVTCPHPDAEARAQDKKVHLLFRKYKNGMISYDILGPLEQKPVGEKIDKYGRTRPEVIKWVDPRTGEQVVVREDGTMTPQGKRLRAMMQALRVNKSNHWEVWVDREFISLNDDVKHNPWDLDK
jgi:hypothetical protein